MARLARIVLPDIPHHVTQRGNGRAQTFFCEADYRLYLTLLADHCRAARVAIWAWCLMPNHVHLILTPADADGLRKSLSKVHRQYAGHIHARERRTGHFWQGRFGCVAMDEAHLAAAIPYVVLNPVRARLVPRAEQWQWSSIHAHLDPGTGDGITDTEAVVTLFPDIAARVRAGEEVEMSAAIRKAETIGRPLGDDRFFAAAESQTGRKLRPKKRGRKKQRLDKSALSP
jgi:putative transposase